MVGVSVGVWLLLVIIGWLVLVVVGWLLLVVVTGGLLLFDWVIEGALLEECCCCDDDGDDGGDDDGGGLLSVEEEGDGGADDDSDGSEDGGGDDEGDGVEGGWSEVGWFVLEGVVASVVDPVVFPPSVVFDPLSFIDPVLAGSFEFELDNDDDGSFVLVEECGGVWRLCKFNISK